MNWPIFVPSNPAPAGTSASAKPIHKQLNAIGRGTIYQVPATSSLAALLAALAAAGEPAPSAAAPVWAHLEGQGLWIHRGSGWAKLVPAGGALPDPVGVVSRDAPIGSASTAVGTGSVTYPAPFAAPPRVLTGSVVTSGGIVVSTYAVSITTTGFTLRWVATGTVASPFTVPWVAVGTPA